MVIIGGGVANAAEFFLGKIEDVISRRAFTTMVKSPEVFVSTLNENASSVGAAAHALDQIMIGKGLPLMSPAP